MEVTAKARYLRISPKKMRLVIDVIRGMSVNDAEAQLKFLNKRGAKMVQKLLQSAVANAQHNFGLKKDNLFIKKIIANEGPTFKRWTAKAMGRAALIRKRTTHLEIVLDEFVPTPKEKIKKHQEEILTKKIDEVKPEEVKIKSEEKEDKTKLAIPQGTKKEKKQGGGFLKKFFQRKSMGK